MSRSQPAPRQRAECRTASFVFRSRGRESTASFLLFTRHREVSERPIFQLVFDGVNNHFAYPSRQKSSVEPGSIRFYARSLSGRFFCGGEGAYRGEVQILRERNDAGKSRLAHGAVIVREFF